MKKKELIKLRQDSVKDLRKKLQELITKKMQLSAKIAIGKEANVRLVKNLRREIAQILTIIHEKEGNKK